MNRVRLRRWVRVVAGSWLTVAALNLGAVVWNLGLPETNWFMAGVNSTCVLIAVLHWFDG